MAIDHRYSDRSCHLNIIDWISKSDKTYQDCSRNTYATGGDRENMFYHEKTFITKRESM